MIRTSALAHSRSLVLLDSAVIRTQTCDTVRAAAAGCNNARLGEYETIIR